MGVRPTQLTENRKNRLAKLFRILICQMCRSDTHALLDGKVFVGQSKEKHKRAVKEDELRFMNGEFQSIGYGQKGFNEGVYAARAEEDKIYFEAETVNPKQGKIKWSGIVHGDSIEVNYRWSKKGWLSDTEKDYSFNRTLKK